MKIINSKPNQKKDIELFFDSDGKNSGFAGNVSLYDAMVYVDTRNGTGYEEVIKKLEPMIYNMATKYHFNGNSFDDTRHDIIVHILEGMPKYNPDKNMKLSSFLQMRVDRRLINELRDKSRKSKNATLLNIVTYNVTCDCGYNFVSTVNKDDMPRCPECGKYVSTEAKKLPVTIFEVNESMARYDDGGSETNASMYERIPDESVQIEDDVIYSYDMNKWLQNEDPRVVKIINLMYFHDYSITAAAKEVGLTGAGANIKLKDLRNNRIVREIFGR